LQANSRDSEGATTAYHGLNAGVWSTLQAPTPEEVWNELLMELKAASQELYVAFVSLAAAPRDNDSSADAAMAQKRERYNEALRRFDAARARVKAERKYASQGLDAPLPPAAMGRR